ncbi:MAG: DnaJ domain-containing protein [Lachnospiraceae bacterium]|nr:DnaJ domain-containing protein [Lachnospiraceae bacterium]
MDSTNTYYDLLEVSRTASEEVIRAAYKAKVKQWHPDNFSEERQKERATKILQNLNEALEILTDSEKRRQYDAGFGYSDTKRQNTYTADHTEKNTAEYAEILDRVQKMIIVTRNEEEYLQLHRQIRHSVYSEYEKRLMQEALDEITAIRLEDDIEKADSLAYCKKEVSEHKSGIIWLVVIGFILSAWIANAWWIAIIIAVLSYLGGKEDREELKRAEQAEERIQWYRSCGFRI